MKRIPEGASPDQRSAWIRRPLREMLDAGVDESDDEMHEPYKGDPQFPYRKGPGHEKARPKVLRIMWNMMKNQQISSYRLDLSESLSSKDNKFLLEFAVACFLKLVECGEYQGVSARAARADIIMKIVLSFAKDRLRRMLVHLFLY